MRVNKRPEEISKWPDFDLMSEGRGYVRAAVAVSREVASIIDRYYTAVARSTADAERIPALAAETLVHVEVLRRIAEQGATPDDSLVNQVTTSAKALEQVANEWNQDRSLIGNRILELGEKVLDLYHSVPATQTNAEVFERFFKFMKDYNAEYKKKTEAVLQRDQANMNRIMESIAKTSGKEITPEEQLRLSVELENLYRNYTSLDFRRMTISEARLWETLGSQIQLLMISPLENKEASWKFSSKRGFTIGFPAGWELLVYPPAASLLLLTETGRKMLEAEVSQAQKLGWTFEARLKNEILANDPGNLGLVALKVFTRPEDGLVGPLTEDERRMIIAELTRQEGFREIEIEREMLNGKWVTITRGTGDDAAGNPVVMYIADIHGASGILTLQFFVAATHAASVIPSCRRLLETIEFK